MKAPRPSVPRSGDSRAAVIAVGALVIAAGVVLVGSQWLGTAGLRCRLAVPDVSRRSGIALAKMGLAPRASARGRRCPRTGRQKVARNRRESLTSFRATNSRPERRRRSSCKCTRSAESGSTPERIRTSDLRSRRLKMGFCAACLWLYSVVSLPSAYAPIGAVRGKWARCGHAARASGQRSRQAATWT